MPPFTRTGRFPPDTLHYPHPYPWRGRKPFPTCSASNVRVVRATEGMSAAITLSLFLEPCSHRGHPFHHRQGVPEARVDHAAGYLSLTWKSFCELSKRRHFFANAAHRLNVFTKPCPSGFRGCDVLVMPRA